MKHHFPKGISKELINYRDHKLAARFYWYSCIIGLKFERCLFHLEKEFDIRGTTIQELITKNSDLITQMEMRDIDTQFLKSLFPFMNWQYLPATKSNNGEQLSLDLFEELGRLHLGG